MALNEKMDRSDDKVIMKQYIDKTIEYQLSKIVSDIVETKI